MFSLWCLVSCVTGLRPQNIVLVLVDDLGWADVTLNDIPTPKLDDLRLKSLWLDRHYANPTCTPSRASLLTGRFAHRTSLTGPLILSSLCGLPDKIPTLPQVLHDELGFSTHLIGKWHLGHASANQLPQAHGFDTFYGSYTGAQSHWDRSVWGALDLRNGTKPAAPRPGLHSTRLWTEAALGIMKETQPPFFLQVAYTAPHAPLQAELEWQTLCSHIVNPLRRAYCGLVVGLDQGIGELVQHLPPQTLLMVLSDNGGMPSAGGLNTPLRGGKNSPWEGGTRVPGLLYYPGVFAPNTTYQPLIHLADWLPTLTGKTLPGVNGQNLWPSLTQEANSLSAQRRVIWSDPFSGQAAIWRDPWKLVIISTPKDSRWYPNPEAGFFDTAMHQLALLGTWLFGEKRFWWPRELLEGLRLEWTQKTVTSGQFLFNIRKDPEERHPLPKDEFFFIWEELQQTWLSDEVQNAQLCDWRLVERNRALEKTELGSYHGPWTEAGRSHPRNINVVTWAKRRFRFFVIIWLWACAGVVGFWIRRGCCWS